METHAGAQRYGGHAGLHDLQSEQALILSAECGETQYPYAHPSEPKNKWPRISGVHGVFKHLDDHQVGGKLVKDQEPLRFFDLEQLDRLRARQVDTVRYLDTVFEKLFDIVPEKTYITVISDHGELFGEDGYFGHGPVFHEKVFEVPFLEGRIR